jgi:hypothetical protein
LLNNTYKSSLIKGAVCTIVLSKGGGGSKIIPLSLKKLSGGALAPLAHPTITPLLWCIKNIKNIDKIMLK